MKARLNQSIVSGVIERVFVSDGKPFVSLNVALEVGRDRTAWIDLVAFGKLATELAENTPRIGDSIAALARFDSVKDLQGVWRRRMVALAFITPDQAEAADAGAGIEQTELELVAA
jgi:hypothetical protein